jgi:hypothetical protein
MGTRRVRCGGRGVDPVTVQAWMGGASILTKQWHDKLMQISVQRSAVTHGASFHFALLAWKARRRELMLSN